MSIKYKNNCDDTLKNIYKSIQKATQEIGITMQAELKNNCPVDIGNMKKDLCFVKIDSRTKVSLKFGNTEAIPYALKVEMVTGKGNAKGFFRRTLRDNTKEIIKIISKHLKGVNK